jgi:hypothetical protein
MNGCLVQQIMTRSNGLQHQMLPEHHIPSPVPARALVDQAGYRVIHGCHWQLTAMLMMLWSAHVG